MVERISGSCLYHRFCMISNAGPGLLHHFEIIGPIADGNDLFPLQSQFFAHFFQHFPFSGRPDDISQYLACQFAV